MKRTVCQRRWGLTALLLVSCTPLPDSYINQPHLEAIDFATPLTDSALAEHQTQFQSWIESELNLLGLGKITSVATPIPSELIEFRQNWAEIDPEVAPFLGTWSRDWNMLPNYFMTVFPSQTLGQVCLIRTRRDMTQTVPFQEVTTPPEFSLAQVVEGQLLGTKTQSAQALLFPTPPSVFLDYETEFLGTVEPDGNQRLYAAQSTPIINPTWDSDIQQQFYAYGCISAEDILN